MELYEISMWSNDDHSGSYKFQLYVDRILAGDDRDPIGDTDILDIGGITMSISSLGRRLVYSIKSAPRSQLPY
jgi:hypothetical protein